MKSNRVILLALVAAATATVTILLLLRFAAPAESGGPLGRLGALGGSDLGPGPGEGRSGRLDDASFSGRLRVLEAGTERPLEGVALRYFEDPNIEVHLQPTDGMGLARIPAFYSVAGPGEILLKHPGFVTRVLEPTDGALTTVRLERAGRILGRLRGLPGVPPPAGLTVLAWPTGRPPRLTSVERGREGVDGLLLGYSNAGGEFVLEGAAPGTDYTVTASGPGQVAVRRRTIRASALSRLEIEVLPSYLILAELDQGEQFPDDRLSGEPASWTAEPDLEVVGEYGLYDPEFAVLGLAREFRRDRLAVGGRGQTRSVIISDAAVGTDRRRRLAGFLIASRIEADRLGPFSCRFSLAGSWAERVGLQAVRVGAAAVEPLIITVPSSGKLTRVRIDFFNRPPELAVAGDFIAAPFGRLRFKDSDSGVEFECSLQESDLAGFDLDGFPVGRFEVRGLLEKQRPQAEAETFWTGRLDSRSDRELVVTVPDRVCSLRGELPLDATFAVLALRRADSPRSVTVHLTRAARFVIPAIKAGEYRLRARIERAGETTRYEARVLVDPETRIGRIDPASFDIQRSR